MRTPQDACPPRLARVARAKGPPLAQVLCAWFGREARDLPFRATRDPYRIWLAEVILQQTRMEAGLAYYERFVRAFPTVRALAAASEEQVLKLWEGLGYYNRARNLQAAARQVAASNGGRLPRTAAAWRRLPGVGPYTAGAVASIAFGEPVPAVDGNVKRVLARLFAVDAPLGTARADRAFWALAARLVPEDDPGAWNQALMELGARVCTPRSPGCAQCPASRLCRAKRTRRVDRLPVVAARRATPHRTVVAAAIRRRGRYLVGKRRPGGMLAGLWEFPGSTVTDGDAHEHALAHIVRETTALNVNVREALGAVDHAYTHFRITLHLYACDEVRGRARSDHYDRLRWVAPRELDDLALPASDRRLVGALPELRAD